MPLHISAYAFVQVKLCALTSVTGVQPPGVRHLVRCLASAARCVRAATTILATTRMGKALFPPGTLVRGVLVR